VAPGIVFTHKRPSFKRARHWVQKDFKKVFDDTDHNNNKKKTLLSDKELDCDIHLGSAEEEQGRMRWENMQWWVHTI